MIHTADTRTPKTSAPAPARAVRTDIQALRALAVAAVLVYHFIPAALPGGYVGVDVFFVVSGFVITTLMITEVESNGALDFGKFYARRARRILPAATATITATVLAGLILLPLNAWQGLANDALFTTIFGQNWHLASTSVNYLAGGGSPSPMQHFWSLSIEEQFYFAWPAALMTTFALLGRARVRTAASLVLLPTIAVTFLFSLRAVHGGDPSAYFTTHTRAWQLAIGALVAVWWPTINRFTGNTAGGLEPGRAPRQWRTMGMVLGGLGLIAYSMLTFDSGTPFPGSAALAPTFGTAAVIAAGLPSSRVAGHRGVQWLGNVSYSLYLVHWPIVVFLPSALPAPLWVGTGLGLSLVLAHISYRYIEQGVPKLFDLLPLTLPNRRTILAGGLLVVLGVGVAGGAHGVSHRVLDRLDTEAGELQAAPPDGFGIDSLHPEQYVDLLPGTRGTAPSRASVRTDVPTSHSDGCVGANTEHSTPACTYGREDGEQVWALVGDSHMDQYLPAFEEIAADQGITLVTYLHANCPYNVAQSTQDREWDGACRDANDATSAELRDLDPDLIITSNWTAREWEEDPVDGFVEAWEDLPAPVVVIADNPAMMGADRTTACVVDNYPDTGVCARPRAEAMPTDHQLEAVDRARARGMDVHLLDSADWYCTEQECPPVIGSVMVYRDPHHITGTYVRTLAPVLAERIERTGWNEAGKGSGRI